MDGSMTPGHCILRGRKKAVVCRENSANPTINSIASAAQSPYMTTIHDSDQSRRDRISRNTSQECIAIYSDVRQSFDQTTLIVEKRNKAKRKNGKENGCGLKSELSEILTVDHKITA